MKTIPWPKNVKDIVPSIIVLVKKIYSQDVSQTLIITLLAIAGVFSILYLNRQIKNIDKKRMDMLPIYHGEFVERTPYFRQVEKQFEVDNIILPTFLKKERGFKKIIIDFTFEASNKYIKAYFEKNPHHIQDMLNIAVEPIPIAFPLQDEGKQIIKKKMIIEMNNLLGELKIGGKITDIHIRRILGD